MKTQFLIFVFTLLIFVSCGKITGDKSINSFDDPKFFGTTFIFKDPEGKIKNYVIKFSNINNHNGRKGYFIQYPNSMNDPNAMYDYERKNDTLYNKLNLDYFYFKDGVLINIDNVLNKTYEYIPLKEK